MMIDKQIGYLGQVEGSQGGGIVTVIRRRRYNNRGEPFSKLKTLERNNSRLNRLDSV